MSATLREIRTNKLCRKQKDIARELGISAEHLSNIESGRVAPGIELKSRIAHVFGISLGRVGDACRSKQKRRN